MPKENGKESTVRRTMLDFRCNSTKPLPKPKLTPRMKEQRLGFANKYKNCTVADWEKLRK